MTKIPTKYRGLVQKRLRESAEVKKKVAKSSLNSILDAAKLITETFQSGRKVLICGNGGSAADSQHMAGEFVCVLSKTSQRPGLPAIALTTDTSILTAYANDFGFENIFQRQVQALGRPDDVLIAISTSGDSSNVISAVNQAKRNKMLIIALTGKNGKLKDMVDISVAVPSTNTQYIQESHIAVIHVVCELVEQLLLTSKQKKYGYK